jgi:hypothetical protein
VRVVEDAKRNEEQKRRTKTRFIENDIVMYGN